MTANILSQPFLREVEVLIGPLSEWQGGGDSKKAVRIFGDGTQNGLRVKFNVKKHIISTANPTTIEIYNLSEGLRSVLRRSGAQIVLRVGWSNTGLTTIFTGSVLAAVSQRENADIVTTITSLAGYGGTSRALVSKTFGGGVTLKAMLEDLAKTIPGVTVVPQLIKVRDAIVGTQGQSFAGPTTAWLDRLAKVYGFSWTINDGVFQALDDAQAFTGTVLVNASSGLMRAEPMLASPMQIQAGVSIQCLLNPHIQPGKSVKLESLLNPKLNGTYKIHTLTHSGDTHSSQWQTSTETWLVL